MVGEREDGPAVHVQERGDVRGREVNVPVRLGQLFQLTAQVHLLVAAVMLPLRAVQTGKMQITALARHVQTYHVDDEPVAGVVTRKPQLTVHVRQIVGRY